MTDPDTIYLQKTLTLSAPATGAVASVMIDDQITLTVNGTQIGFFDSDTCGSYFNHQFTIPDGILHAGDNLIRVTAVNIPTRLPNNKSVDLEITGTLAFPADASFGGCLLYKGCARDPVDTSTGNLIYQHTDVAIPGRGGGLTFARAYNSEDTRGGPLGPGWTHTYNARVVDTSPTIQVIRWNGRTDRDTLNGTSYTPPPGVFDTLQKESPALSDGTVWLLTQTDQSQLGFDTNGRLLYVKDRYGNTTTLGYNASSQLASVTDPAGRGSLTLSYDTHGHLVRVTDWLSPARTVQFGYDANGRLSTVTDRTNQVTTYGYDGTSSRLTTITDANGHVAVTHTYDAQGRVATQTDALGLTTGQQTTYIYTTNGDGSTTTTVAYPATSIDPNWLLKVSDTYDTSGRLIRRVSQPTSSESYTEQYTYDANFNLGTLTDARGNTTMFCYDVDYTGAAVTGSVGNLTRQISPPPATGANPLVTLYTYDSKNNLIETIPPRGVSNGATVTCSTDLSASINSVFATDTAYDATQTELLAVTRRYSDPDSGSQTAVTRFEYGDPANPGLVTKIIPPRGNTGPSPDDTYATAFTYYGSGSQAGMLQRTTDPLGNTTSYTYDAVGRRLGMVDPNGNVSGANPADHTWSYSYDNEDRLTQVQAPAPTSGGSPLVTRYQYDPVGNRTVVIDANGQVTKYLYDARDSLAEVDQSPSPWTDPNATPSPRYVTSYQYDNLGNPSRVVRAQGDPNNERVTDYSYDGLNRLRSETQYPSWPATTPTLVSSYTYDGNGNRLTLKDPLNQTTTYGYDPLNRLTSITYSDGTTPNVGYSYDANGNRTSMTDGTGTTTYLYDELDRLTRVSSPANQTVGYRYDLDGNRTKLIYPDGTAVQSTFDKASRLGSLLDWANRTTSYQYFPDGSLKQITKVNGTTATYAYDNALRLTQVLNQKGPATISQHTYTLDAVGNRTQVQEILPVLTVPGAGDPRDWGKNNWGQVGNGTTTDQSTPIQVSNLTAMTQVAAGSEHSLGLKSDGTVWTWGNNSYGELGNNTTTSSSTPIQVSGLNGITSIAGGGWHSLANAAVPTNPSLTTSYGYDSLDRLTNVNSGSTSYSYDPVGNRLTKITTSYTYDRADRILTAGSVGYTVNANGNLVARGSDTFSYDQANRLTSATVGGATTTATYDGDGKRASQTVGGTTTSYVYDVTVALPNVLTDGTLKYVYGLGLTYAVDGSGNVQVYHVDGLGSVRAITDASGNVIQTYQTDEFGIPTRTQGNSTQPFQYTGQQRDASTGLYYLRARMYDPGSGRFVNRDTSPPLYPRRTRSA